MRFAAVVIIFSISTPCCHARAQQSFDGGRLITSTVITPTVITPTVISPTLITPTVITPTLINTPTMHPGCIIISFLIATPNNYRIIARSGYWKYDHDCRKTHQIKRVCGTCYAHEFNLNAFRHEWSYIQYSRRAINYYIYFIDENKRLKRSCLVLSYFEQDIKKCISSSISHISEQYSKTC
jgi:hypothetical protein